jgi:Tol biopolymer transport system component
MKLHPVGGLISRSVVPILAGLAVILATASVATGQSVARPANAGTAAVAGPTGPTEAREAALSGSGRVLAFVSAERLYAAELHSGSAAVLARGGGAPDVSATGRYVAFESFEPLVAGDTQGWDVFVVDRKTHRITRASPAPLNGAPGNARNPSISADGRYVAFESFEPLVAGDTQGWDVFVVDRRTHRIERVSPAPRNGAPGNAVNASISANGRTVAFESFEPLVAGDTQGWDVFVVDRKTHKIELVSAAAAP